MTDQEARSIWTSLGLKSPANYVRSLEGPQIQVLVCSMGHKKAAAHWGLSESALKAILVEMGLAEKVNKPELSEEELVDALTTYRSIRFAARMLKTTESWLRERAKALDVDARLLIDWSTGNNANAKGRRAEQDYAKMRGSKILKDLNITEGSQSDYDFDDAEHGRVNVKSSRLYKYKASTRKDSPFFGKFSMNAFEKCDTLALLLYDSEYKTLVGVKLLSQEQCQGILSRTFTLLLSEADSPSSLEHGLETVVAQPEC